MGFQDREYFQEDAPRGFTLSSGKRMVVTNLVIINVVIWLADAFTTPIKQVAVQNDQLVEAVSGRWLSHFLALKLDVFQQPWMLWEVLSYGFAHASLGTPNGFWHILFNMFLLWMFGRDVEGRYGSKEFLAFYLLSDHCCRSRLAGLEYCRRARARLAGRCLRGRGCRIFVVCAAQPPPNVVRVGSDRCPRLVDRCPDGGLGSHAGPFRTRLECRLAGPLGRGCVRLRLFPLSVES